MGASPVSQHFSIPVLFEAGVTNTGIALANVSGQNAQDILLELVDSDGTVLSTQMRDVEGDHHEALFANQFFLELDAMGSFEGSIRVWVAGRYFRRCITATGVAIDHLPISRVALAWGPPNERPECERLADLDCRSGGALRMFSVDALPLGRSRRSTEEARKTAIPRPVCATCPGDTNLDDQLDFGDLLLLSKHLLTPSLEGPAL